LAEAVQGATGGKGEFAYYVDRSCIDEEPAEEVRARGIQLEVVKQP